MEGTRHERIALVVVAYVIGFITAFIAFGVNKISDEFSIPATTVIKVQTIKYQTPQDPVITTMQVNQDGLFAVSANGYKRLLTANANYLSASALAGVGKYGAFFKIIDMYVSTNGKFAYFCEQLKEADDSCVPYVYSLSDDTLYKVRLVDASYNSKIEGHKASWSKDDSLSLDSYVSADPAKPWALSSQ